MKPKLFQTFDPARLLKQYRELVYLMVAALCLVTFTDLTPPFGGEWLAESLFGGLRGDLPVYASRFLLSFLFLGLIPLTAVLLFREKLPGLGLCRPKTFLPGWFFWMLVLFWIVVGLVAAYTPASYAFYPYSRTLLHLVEEQGFGWFALHGLLYLLCYYLPWEFFFRGFLIFPFLRLVNEDEKKGGAALLIVASFQTIPSTLLHFGHPAVETYGAVIFGVFAAYLVIKTRSILPGLVFHATIGLATDLFIQLRFLEVLP